jgi:hypothetical protein
MRPLALGLTMALALTGWEASAQDTAAPALVSKPPAVEVTPFVSLGSTGSSLFGGAISFPITSNLSLETEIGYRKGEGNLNALDSHASLLYALPRLGRTTPYLAGGIGLKQYGAPIVAPNQTIVGTEPRVALVVNAGGGVKVAGADWWDMRTDARWFNALGRDAGETWRVAQGVSFDVAKR